MIQLIDKVDCDALQKSIVRPEAIKRAVLVQDAGHKDDLFALLMVCDRRAVLVAQGVMSLHAGTVSSTLKMQAFRTLLGEYPGSRKEADALLKSGYCQIALGQRAEGEATLRDLTARHPGTEASAKAESRLRTLALESR